jgi:geranylgeranyl reductase family protein
MTNESRDFDVVVVGAGPAGASSARCLAQKGFKVLLIEKAKTPRYKTCGGGVTGRALKLLPPEALSSIEVECKDIDFQISPTNIKKNILRDEAIIVMTMRDRLDQSLVDAAVANGAQFLDECTCTGFEKNKSGYLVYTSKGNFSCRSIIAADGVQSKIAKQAGFKKIKKFWPALEWELFTDAESLRRFEGKAFFDLNYYSGGYAWIFPKKNHLSVGLAGPMGANMQQELEKFLARESLVATRIEKHGYLVPSQTRPGGWAKDGIFLVGDSAGFVDPMLGEGIYFGLLSGQLVAEALSENLDRAEELYIEKVKAQIIPDLKSADALARVLYCSQSVQKFIFNRAGNYYIEQMVNVVIGKRSYPKFSFGTVGAIKTLSRHFLSDFQRTLLQSILKVIAGGVIVGLLHSSPWLLAASLLCLLFYKYQSDRKTLYWDGREKQLWLGMLAAFALGFTCEWIGTNLGWWTYKYFETGMKVPPWVPLGWVFAFRIFFRIEKTFLGGEKSNSSVNSKGISKGLIFFLITLLLPPLGEIIAMSFGTWKYAFMPQLWGMPLQAVLLIACVHWLNFFIVNLSKNPQTAPE